MNENWKNKDSRAVTAQNWTKLMESHYLDQIKYSVSNTYKYVSTMSNSPNPKDFETKIIVSDTDSVSAIFSADSDNIAVLNFASYKIPGGAFIDGAMAQEEALCHKSWLYNVLIRMQKSWYDGHATKLNRALYHDDLLYSKKIGFFQMFGSEEITMKYADVITCAAPNKAAAQRYQHVSDKEIAECMQNRIDAILTAAYSQGVDTLILGAFGCGVFGNDPAEVAHIFNKLLGKYKNVFKTVIFAIPSGNNNNLAAFQAEFAK